MTFTSTSIAVAWIDRIQLALKRGEGSHNAKPAIVIGIQKQPAANTLDLTATIEATLDDIQRALPEGMQIHRDLFRQADFIEQSLNNLTWSLLIGCVLVLLILVLFLYDWRTALISSVAMPLSLLAAAVILLIAIGREWLTARRGALRMRQVVTA